MSGPTPPPSSEDPSIKEEFSSPPDLLQEFNADVLSSDAFQNELLMEALDQGISSQNVTDPSAHQSDVDIQDASSRIDQSGSKTAATSPLRHNMHSIHDASTLRQEDDHPVPPQDQAELFLQTQLQQAGELPHDSSITSALFDDEAVTPGHNSDACLVPDTSATENSPGRDPHYNGSSTNSSTTRRKLARTAREWHEERRKQSSYQRRGPSYKRQQLAKLRKMMRKAPKNKNQAKLSKLKIPVLDPKTYLNGGFRDPSSPKPVDPDAGEGPKITASSKRDYWRQFRAQNPDLDLHKCRGQWKELDQKSASFGFKIMKKHNEYWELKGMESTLYDHQLIGTAFMVERECSEDGPNGSICADDMGMGKTIQTFATIVGNPPTDWHIKRNQKTTLIVVPSSIRGQWIGEFKKHVPELAENMMQFISSREDNSVKRLTSADIVLTTYWELFQSLPHPDKKIIQLWISKNLDLFEAYRLWAEENSDARGLLHQIHWYRVVLDEGQFIKNYLSRTSRAAVALESNHRLLLSGTPIMNGYEEFFPLLRFLREPLTMALTPTEFQTKYCNEKDMECVQSLGIILSDLIIRRTMQDSLFNGQPLVKLPKYHKQIREVEASWSEKLLVLAIQLRLREIRNVQFPEGDERNKLRYRLAQLTRLRQLTANPDLISQQIVLLLEIHELVDLREKIKPLMSPRKTKAVANVLYKRLAIWIRDKKTGTYKTTPADTADEVRCLTCNEPTEDLMLIKKCEHTFCGFCLEEYARSVWDEDMVEEMRVCPARDCEVLYRDATEDKPKKDWGIKSYYEAKIQSKRIAKALSTSVTKAKDARDFRPSPGPDQPSAQKWLQKLDNKEINVLPTAKLIGVMGQIRDWIHDTPEDKIIVFTQFRPFQVMVGSMLEKEKVGFVYFSGDMAKKQREKALQIFRDNPKIKVMVAGLKCGGLGLNLSFANRVIISDPWWNSCVDNQAFGRVYRIGQKKQTYLVKIVVNETVDTRILKLQETKERAVSAALQDDLTSEEWDELLGGGDEVSWDQFLDNLDLGPGDTIEDENADEVDLESALNDDDYA